MHRLQGVGYATSCGTRLLQAKAVMMVPLRQLTPDSLDFVLLSFEGLDECSMAVEQGRFAPHVVA